MMRQVYTECANIKISLLCMQYRCEVGAGGWLLTGSLHADGVYVVAYPVSTYRLERTHTGH
jgi:hypothetical protein